jgi:hypothetical protein
VAAYKRLNIQPMKIMEGVKSADANE